MFKGTAANPYDEVVAKTTDENLTSENWELILTLCDKVADEGEQGARNVLAALLKRLAHRNPNVQLYAFSLAEALTKNCGIEVHREIASRSFTQALEKIITDRMTHDKVKKRALGLIAMWAADFKDNASLGIMEECFNNLKAKNYKFEQPAEAPPPTVDDELLRKEEEELQRVLEMSMHDKGGRNQWGEYTTASSSGAGGSGSSSNLTQPIPARVDPVPRQPFSPNLPNINTTPNVQMVKAATPISPVADTPSGSQVANTMAQSTVTANPSDKAITRVRALHSFQPTEPGELQFEKGDIIKVVDRNYKDWWRGQLRGRTGIFPVNYVEPLPEQTSADIAREAEQEAAIFSQAANIDKLLSMLRNLDPAKDSLADNEEIQELYRQSMSLRPKIVKLIDKYNQKKAELVLMNESFVKAKTIFERMMEDSLARHTTEYGNSVPIAQQPQQVVDYNRRVSNYGTWNPSAYDQGAAAGYPYGPNGRQAFSPAVDMNVYGPQTAGFGPVHPAQSVQQPYAGEPAYPLQHAPAFPQGPVAQQIPVSQAAPEQSSQIPQPLPQQQQLQPQQQPPPQQPPPQQQPVQNQQAHTALQVAGQVIEDGPPYDYNPTANYADPGAQAWAQYYAQGGTDPAGAVYFKFVPGITDVAPAQADAARVATSDPGMIQQTVPQGTEPLVQAYGQTPWDQQAASVPNIRQGNQSPVLPQQQGPTGFSPGYLNGYGQESSAISPIQQQHQFSTHPARDPASARPPTGPGGIPV